MNVDGMRIKIDMPASQYGTLEVNGNLYNIHVSELHTKCIETYPPCYIFTLVLKGDGATVREPNEPWEDSYEWV